MAVVIPFAISAPGVTNIIRVVSLYSPIGAFQGGQVFDTTSFGDLVQYSDSQLTRNVVPSFGFPHSVDQAGPASATDGIPVPQSAYAVVNPTLVYPIADSRHLVQNSILLLDVSVSPVQPGFSRLRVDYLDANNVAQIQYFDVPYYEGWDLHSTQLQEIVDFNTNAFNFIQAELSNFEKEVNFLDSHMFYRGLTVSGSVSATQATSNLQAQMAAHSMPMPDEEMAHSAPTFSHLITSGSTSGLIYAGQQFNLDLGITAVAGDTITVAGYPIPTTIAGTEVYGTAPAYIPYTVNLPVTVINRGLLRKAATILTFAAPPHIAGVFSADGSSLARPGSLLTIYGTNFTPTAGTVKFNNVVAQTISWTDSAITSTVPTTAYSGDVVVTVNGHSATTKVSIYNPRINTQFIVTPALNVLLPGQSVQFRATFNGSPISPSWSIVNANRNIGSGNISYGTITKDGLFTAPPMAAKAIPVAIVANYASPYGPTFAEASVATFPTSSTLTVSPSASMVAPLYTERFVLYNSGVPVNNNNVEWSVNGIPGGNDQVGTITSSGLYQAPIISPSIKAITVSGLTNGQASSGAVRVTANTSFGHIAGGGSELGSLTNTQLPRIPTGGGGGGGGGNIAITPTPTIDSVGQGCPGQAITITGRYWSIDGSTAFFALGDGTAWTIQTAPTTTDNINYSASILVPGSYANNSGPYTIYVSVNAKKSSTTATPNNQFLIPASCSSTPPTNPPPAVMHTLTITGLTQVCASSSHQFTASYDGSDVTATATWSANAPGGLYTSMPSVGSEQVTATYQGLNTTQTENVVNCTPPTTPPSSGCDQLTVVPGTATVNIPGGTQQFQAYVSINSGTPNQITPKYWTVNGIIGGNNIYGTVTPNGLYTAPGSAPPYQQAKVGALYQSTTESLQGYAVVTFQTVPQKTGGCNVVVTSQLNYFFGDGRSAFTSTNGQVYGLGPGNVLVAVYQETLSNLHVPVYTPVDPLVALIAFDSTNLNQNYGIYNTLLTKNVDGTYTRYQYIVIGICDPNDGIFHEMWDLLNPGLMRNQNIQPAPPCAHGMFLSPSKQITIEDYAKKKLKKNKISLAKLDITEHLVRPHGMFAGVIDYSNDTLVVKNLTLHANGKSVTFDKQSFTINKEGEYLVALPTSNGTWELHTVSVDDTLFESSRTYVVGKIVDDRFVPADNGIATNNSSVAKIKFEKLSPAMQKIVNRMKESKIN